MASRKPWRFLSFLRNFFVLWLAGCKDAICMHRCVVFFVHNTVILVKFSQCFVLNIVIFLGSVLALQYGLAPGVQWLLGSRVQPLAGDKVAAWAQAAVLSLYNISWLLPAYLVSLIVNCLWYQEIADLAYKVLQDRAVREGLQQRRKVLRQHPPQVIEMIAQEIYRVVLFGIFFLTVFASGSIPYIGGFVYYVLLSWLYAFYCFDYKWSLTNHPLGTRIQLFESRWAFFLGFGNACTIVIMLTSFYTGAAIIGVLFPLFILVASDSDPLSVYEQVAAREAAKGRVLDLGRAPIFDTSTWLTSAVIRRFSTVLVLANRCLTGLAWLQGRWRGSTQHQHSS